MDRYEPLWDRCGTLWTVVGLAVGRCGLLRSVLWVAMGRMDHCGQLWTAAVGFAVGHSWSAYTGTRL